MALNEQTKINRKNIEALLANAYIKPTAYNEKIKTISSPISTYKMPPLKDLEKRWGEFETHFGLYEATYDAVRYVGRLLTSKDFTTHISQYYNEKTSGSIEELLRALLYKDNDYYFMDVGPKFIQTKMNFGEIKVTINPNSDPQSIMDGENILKALFPKYKTPTKWEKRTIEEQSLGSTVKIDKYSVGEDLTNTIAIKKFGDIKPRFVSPNDKFKIDEMAFKLPRKYFDNNFDGIASLKLTLKQSDVQPQSGTAYRLRDQTEGSISDGSFIPTIEVEIEAIYNWPVEFAYYVTCAKGPNDFIPFIFFQYLSWHKAVYSGGRTRGGGFGTRPSRINHLGNIVDRNKAEQAKGRNPKNRVNDEGFVAIGVGESSETGNVYWVPTGVDKVSAYLDQIKGAYNSEDKHIDLSRIKIKGEGLYTDWFNEKFTYLREEGVKANAADVSGLQTIDLTGSVPLDNITIYKNMSIPLKTDSEGDLEWFISIMRKFLQGDMRGKGAAPKENYSSPVYLKSMGFNIDRITDKGNMKDYIASVFYSWSNRGLKFGWANIGGFPLVFQPQSADDVLESKNAEYFKDIRTCFNFIKVVASDMLAQIDSLDLGYIHKLSKLRYILVMISNYASKYNEFKLEHDNQVKNNEISHIPDLAYTAGLNSLVAANLPGITRLMPHQLETNIQMLPVPPASLIEISAGGGKCGHYDTLVPTSLGLVKLGEIYHKFSTFKFPNKGFKRLKDNFNVIGLNGKDKAVASYKTKGKTVVLETKMGDKLEFLKEHRFHVFNTTTGFEDWKHVENIQVGDWLPKTYKTRIFANKIPVYEYKNKKYKLTEELTRILGFLVSEGHITRDTATFINADSKSLDMYKKDWNIVFDKPCRSVWRKGNYDISTKYMFCYKEERKCLFSVGLNPCLSSDKEIPLIIRQAPEHLQLQFLRTLFEGDGGIYEKSKNRSKIEYYSTSKMLATQVKMMLENIGIFSEMTKGMKGASNGSNTKKVCYTLEISQEHYLDFSRKIGFISEDKTNKLKAFISHRLNLHKQKQDTNEEAHGFYNKLPVGSFANRLLNRLELLLSNFKYTTKQDAQRACGLPWFWKNAFSNIDTEKHHRLQSVKANRLMRDYRRQDGIITRYSVYRLIRAIKMLPREIHRTVFNDGEFALCHRAIKNSLKYVWTQVVKKEYRKTIKPVYDISIEGSHAYVAHGYMSHNTVVELLEICRMLYSGEINRAIVVVPGNLVRNWVNEIQTFSKGKVNSFALNINTLRRMQYAYNQNPDPVQKPDYDMLKKIINGLPKNTIIVTSYRFLANDRERIVYGNKIIQRYYIAEFLRDIGFDMVALDECFPGCTHVLIDYHKSVPIKEIYENDSITHVLSYNLKTKKIERKKITNKFRHNWKQGKDSWTLLTVRDKENGLTKTLRVTPNHQVFLSDGSEVCVSNLKPRDKLITYGDKYDLSRVAPDGKIVPCGRKYTRYIHTINPPIKHITKCPHCDFKDITPRVTNHRIKEHGEFPEMLAQRTAQIKILNKNYDNKAQSERMIASNPMHNKATRVKAGIGVSKAFWAKPKKEREIQVSRFINAPFYNNRKANKAEQSVIDLNVANMKYTGNGSYFIKLKVDEDFKTKNPDFIRVPFKCGTCNFKSGSKCSLDNETIRPTKNACKAWERSPSFRTNKVVEVMDFEYWHSKSEIKPLMKAYKNVGVDCLIIDAKMPISDKKARIESHINNHYVEVVKVSHVGCNNAKDLYKYDIEVEDNSNYFALAGITTSGPGTMYSGTVQTIPILVHNSHTAKNLKSNSTTAVAILLSLAKYKRELSGTAVFDNVGDLVGQSGIMVPSALGSDSKFSKTFAESGEWDIDAPTRITDAMRPYIKRITHKRQKWAAMLPQLIESFRVVNMTPKQRQFYDSILEDKIEELKKSNPKLYAKLMDGNDKDAAAISTGLATYFQAVEQFIYAPDSNEAFTQLDDLEPEDLISPKVAAVVDILNDHFNGYKDDLGREHAADPHKVIIFSHRTKTSQHMMRHMPANYQKRAVRYVAGDFQALQRFLTDKSIDILIADELSINTGQNLQLASRMIRLETLWSPGSQEQAIARIWRPAFKVGSDRQKVYMNWIYTNLSLEVTKIGRLISKILTKTKYDQQDNNFFVKDKLLLPAEFKKRWSNDIPQINSSMPVNDMLGSLPLLKMNIKTLTTFNTQDKLREYFAYYALMGYWEDREFDRLKSEQRYTKTVDLPPSAYKEIPNSKATTYIPRVPGVDPTVFDPDDKMGYRPISIIENDLANTNDNDSDSEEETETEINPVEINTLVDTEFGYGRVTKILQKEVWVDIPGLGEVKVPKTTAWVITNKEAENRIAKQIASGDPRSNIRLPPQVLNVIKTKPVKQPVVYEPDEEDENDITYKPSAKKHEPVDEFDEEDEEEKQLPIWASIIDTQIALNTEYNSSSEFLVDEMGWKLIAPYTALQIPNAVALDKVINKLQSVYQINNSYIKNLDYYKTMLLNHSLDVAQPNMINQTMRFFNIEEHKKLNVTALRPFPIIWDNKFYIAFDKANTPVLRRAINTVKLLGIPNLVVVQNDEMAVKFYGSKDQAIEDIKKLNKLHSNPHLSDALKTLNAVKTRKNTVTVTDKKQSTTVIPRFNSDSPKPKTLLKLSINAPKPAQTVSPKTTTTIKQVDRKPVFKLNLRGLGKQK